MIRMNKYLKKRSKDDDSEEEEKSENESDNEEESDSESDISESSSNENIQPGRLVSERDSWKWVILLSLEDLRNILSEGRKDEVENYLERVVQVEEPFLSDIVEHVQKWVDKINKVSQTIKRSSTFKDISDKILYIQNKYERMPDKEANKKAWLKMKFDIRELVLQHKDLLKDFEENVQVDHI